MAESVRKRECGNFFLYFHQLTTWDLLGRFVVLVTFWLAVFGVKKRKACLLRHQV